MKFNAEQLLKEADRLLAEAAELDPKAKLNVRAVKKKATPKAQKN